MNLKHACQQNDMYAFVGQKLALPSIMIFLKTEFSKHCYLCMKEYLAAAGHKKFTSNKMKVLNELRLLKS